MTRSRAPQPSRTLDRRRGPRRCGQRRHDGAAGGIALDVKDAAARRGPPRGQNRDGLRDPCRRARRSASRSSMRSARLARKQKSDRSHRRCRRRRGWYRRRGPPGCRPRRAPRQCRLAPRRSSAPGRSGATETTVTGNGASLSAREQAGEPCADNDHAAALRSAPELCSRRICLSWSWHALPSP